MLKNTKGVNNTKKTKKHKNAKQIAPAFSTYVLIENIFRLQLEFEKNDDCSKEQIRPPDFR